MADGYAQASGKLAAVNVHTSPGLGNSMGMLYDAMKAGSPLLLTAGQHDRILKQRTLALKGFSAEDDRYIAMDLVNPTIDYVGLAKSLGVPGELVEKTADVGPAMRRGLASGGPYLIDARIDGSFKK